MRLTLVLGARVWVVFIAGFRGGDGVAAFANFALASLVRLALSCLEMRIKVSILS